MTKIPNPVHFVGAGPGAPDLITLRGKTLLETADLVIYAGSLVNPEILLWCRDSAVIMDSASMDLTEQVEAMERSFREGLSVVRLHTGDPSLYGAVAEQKRSLEDRGIPVVFVPGVSSLQASAAALGIQYTVPGGTQTLICTRRAGRTPVPQSESLEKLASHGATMVMFLSSDQAQEVAEDLITGGIAPETPSACVYRASWDDQIVIRSTLLELPGAMRERSIDRQALIIVGQCIDPGTSASLLYDRTFSHGFREGRE
ncbi:precorrin-4 C(11)-methyltransferase [Dethiosulfovibrio salsuginis]|uniref:Precorrin-4/cobalt-precorrin-4 C11-methyltransferase n=1 Tax=Dethiosulfovibrio salsuginis TaxID=561720 RepID=A0A1X7KDI3_9BACT|nr:precorrin-4 C(11)-methyltransferase [Dethiosulfovibrio salsuginis]SMG38940.1 precorrin-4/cobalt-precorrin-4 C11-methyltransferase [Dethiosulfovibrio salsuginis]